MSDIRLFTRSAVAVATAAVLVACGDSTAPADTQSVSLSFMARESAPAFSRQSALMASRNITITVGDGSLIITRAQLVFRDVKLEGVATTSCRDDDSSDDDLSTSIAFSRDDDDDLSSSDSRDGDGDCNEVRIGPMLVELPLDGGPMAAATIALPAGSYREIKLKLHPPQGGQARDGAFLAANPSFAGVSVRLEGTYNGQPFVHTSDVNAEAEMEFSTPFLVETAGSNLTIAVDLSGWFRDSSGNLIDPATARNGGVNEARVDGNIKASFRAFHDDDRDGDDDDRDGGDNDGTEDRGSGAS